MPDRGPELANALGARPDPVSAGDATARRDMVNWLLSGINHSSRNALQQIGSCAELMSLMLDDRPDVHELIHGVEEAQTRLVRIFDDLRQFASPLTLAPQSVELAELWKKVWQDVTSQGVWPQAALRQTAAPADTRCQADPALLATALARLFMSALDAAAPPATIEIGCRVATLAGRPALEISITDPSRLLAADQLHDLFEPFAVADRRGSGLGLAIALRIAEMHGGELRGESAGDQGTRLFMTLPLMTLPLMTPPLMTPPPMTPPRAGR